MRFSFEFFPARTPAGERQLAETAKKLAPLRPAFGSMTYGAGGSGRESSNKGLQLLLDTPGMDPAAHITVVGQPRAEVDAQLQSWLDAGVKRFVALRGDMPDMARPYRPHPEGYPGAVELVASLRRMGAEDISVGCYPEGHPESPSIEAELEHLKRKLDAGADRAVSQFFFNIDDFLRFRDRAVRAGITQPLVPGIVPVHDFNKVKSFAERCGATVPDWVGERFAGLEDDPETRGQVGAVIAADLCRDLRAEGIEDFHFYTLNKAPMTLAICRLLGIRPDLQEAA
ncbi:methylenetetrahydrofolate reductase [Aquibaculum sediminis]|uniref:methylenetetrahydrofolate reductase n=1 Tax=Aquibaculum sediminis TaxID=3231907 RepID=UPI003455DED3